MAVYPYPLLLPTEIRDYATQKKKTCAPQSKQNQSNQLCINTNAPYQKIAPSPKGTNESNHKLVMSPSPQESRMSRFVIMNESRMSHVTNETGFPPQRVTNESRSCPKESRLSHEPVTNDSRMSHG